MGTAPASGNQAGNESPLRPAENPALENIDYALSELNELGQRWEKRLTLENLRPAERYLNGELEIAVYHSVIPLTMDFDGFECVSVFNNLAGVLSRHLQKEGDLYMRAAGDCWNDPHFSIGRPYGDDSAVFIRDVKLVEGEYQAIPSWVRLEIANYGARLLAGSIYCAYGGFAESSLSASERESSAPCGLTAIGSYSPLYQIIQRDSEVMGEVADQQRKRLGQWLADLKNVPSFITLVLTDEGIGVAPFESGEFCVEVSKVLFGPFDL